MMTSRVPVDPDVAALIAAASTRLGADPLPTPEDVRTSEALLHAWMRGALEPELGHVPSQDSIVGDTRVRWYGDEPTIDSDVVVYIHGGGWLAGDLDSYDPDVRRLAARLDRPVVSIDYRRTPEHPFPAAIEDCCAVLRGLQHTPHRTLSLAGDSAGANLALGTTIATRAENLVAALLLLYPVVDPTAFGNASYTLNGDDYLLTADAMRQHWDRYTQTDEHRRDPHAAPRFAELRGLPPTVIVSADYDPLRDEDRELAARLVAADVATTYLPNPGLTHGFQQMVPRVRAAARALDRAYAAFASLLASTAPLPSPSGTGSPRGGDRS